VLVVRSELPPTELAAMLDRTLSSIERNLPLTLHSWPDAMAVAFFPARAATAALGIMGLLAAMLAITGTFGVATYSVSKRMKEFGIRVALGAARVELIRAALGRPLVLLLSGSIAGLMLGMLASRLLAQIVYKATPRDPLVLAGTILTMTLLGLLATWLPAQRSLSIDPARLLREEWSLVVLLLSHNRQRNADRSLLRNEFKAAPVRGLFESVELGITRAAVPSPFELR